MKPDVGPEQDYPRERKLWWVARDKRIAVEAVVDIGLLVVLKRFCGRVWWILWLMGGLLAGLAVIAPEPKSEEFMALLIGAGVGLVVLGALLGEFGDACEHELKEWMKDARDAK